MENPATWGKAETIIHRVLNDHRRDSYIIGLSLERRITDALREEGLLVEDE